MNIEKIQGKIQGAVHMSSTNLESILKSAVGFLGSITAASINTWIGIIAGILTCVYMCLQVEAALRKRKKEKADEAV